LAHGALSVFAEPLWIFVESPEVRRSSDRIGSQPTNFAIFSSDVPIFYFNKGSINEVRPNMVLVALVISANFTIEFSSHPWFLSGKCVETEMVSKTAIDVRRQPHVATTPVDWTAEVWAVQPVISVGTTDVVAWGTLNFFHALAIVLIVVHSP